MKKSNKKALSIISIMVVLLLVGLITSFANPNGVEDIDDFVNDVVDPDDYTTEFDSDSEDDKPFDPDNIKYGDQGGCPHSKYIYKPKDKDEDKHVGQCTRCGKKITEPHTFGPYTCDLPKGHLKCKKCKAIVCMHDKYNFTITPTKHSAKCAYCRKEMISEEDHIWVLEACDESTHTLKCKICGYEKTEEHDIKWYQDATGHVKKCSCELCGKIEVQGPHNMVHDPITHINYCKDGCGHSYRSNTTTVYLGDNEYGEKCSDCGKITFK